MTPPVRSSSVWGSRDGCLPIIAGWVVLAVAALAGHKIVRWPK